ncbi:MAG: penicillin-binding transpeptidase domain-containing protein [Phascolarctobacterium sp.]|uniref:penicillin-binding transpeptidase domain-containing protein n=1 Tax=Phascolarctobacterium sp. TaxID=2049039 RepID=UPI0026DD9914|nr:penicillin-binding transpeptidase domain-containing protein [Phascolarctobacterium sp.]MDO4920403.1 penicillin-binding transpeptidase domain-containing protein [Phascolarctobacterium sp.]
MSRFTLYDGRKRFSIVCLLLTVVFVGVALRLAWLQIVRARDLSQMSQLQLTADLVQKHPRGRIVDRDGEELAVSIMTGSLYADPEGMVDSPESAKQKPQRDVRRISADLLAPVLHMDADGLYKTFAGGGRFVWLKRTMEPKEVEQVRKLIKDNKLPGLHFLEESKRYYTKKRTAAQILGFIGTDDVGLSGIEYQLNDVLKGKDTKYSLMVDAAGQQILGSLLNDDAQTVKKPKEQLPTVYLTLDSKMQYVLEDAMDDAISRTKARGAAAIIMDPYTGEILGMASRPTFDPNNFGKYNPDTWNNKAISMIYEPGSVFKPIVGCMGLTEGIITPDTIFQDDGSIRIADRVIHNWDGEGMGPVPFATIIKFSINTGMVQLGMQLGADRLISYAKKFGFGSPTGIDLPGEEYGILYDPKMMYEPDVATMAIGQGVAVTPIQVLRAICAIANGGELLQPYIVKKIVAPDGTVISEGQKHVVRNVITPQVARQMRDMMEKVVSEGGGKPAAIKGYRIAGKTGTAEKLAEGGGYAAGQYIASFVGFVPADKPMYAMLVMLDTPQGAFYGSQVSAPIFRDTLQQILVAKGIQPASSEGLPSFEEMNAVGAKETAKQRPAPQIQLLPDGKIKLPDFSGIDMRLAAELLQQGRLRMKPYGSGHAYQQRPEPGTEVGEGATVEIWFR